MAGQPTYIRQPEFTETLKHGSKTVAIAGVAEPLSLARTPCIEISIQAKPANTAPIFIGGASVPNDGSVGNMLGIPVAGQTPASISISAQDLSQVFINTTIAGEGVNILYW